MRGSFLKEKKTERREKKIEESDKEKGRYRERRKKREERDYLLGILVLIMSPPSLTPHICLNGHSDTNQLDYDINVFSDRSLSHHRSTFSLPPGPFTNPHPRLLRRLCVSFLRLQWSTQKKRIHQQSMP